MKTCFNSRRNALFNAYIAVCIFFISMLTAKERHVRFVSWFLVCLRGVVVKAHGTLVNASYYRGRFESESSFISASEDWNNTDGIRTYNLRVGRVTKTEASTTRP